MGPSKAFALKFYWPKLLGVLRVRECLALAHIEVGGFLTDDEEKSIRDQSTPFNQADTFFAILLTKNDDAFDQFCEILEIFGENIWCSLLKERVTMKELEGENKKEELINGEDNNDEHKEGEYYEQDSTDSDDTEEHDEPAEDEHCIVKEVLDNLRDYLKKHLCIDKEFIADLYANKMFNKETANKLRAQIKNEGQVDMYDFIGYMNSFYDDEKLKEFCAIMEHHSRSLMKPVLADIAQRIRKEMMALSRKRRPAPRRYNDSDAESEPDELSIKEPTCPLFDSIILEYLGITDAFFRACKSPHGPKLTDIRYCCRNLIKIAFQEKRRLELEEELDGCSSVEDMAQILFFTLNRWINFEFLTIVVGKFHSSLREVDSRLHTYKQNLKNVLERKLEDVKVLRSTYPQKCKSPKGMLKLVAKYRLDSGVITVKTLIEEKHFLADRLEIPGDLLQVISWGPGSLFIVFFTLKEFKEHLIKQIKIARSALQLRSIDYIAIGDDSTNLLAAPKASVSPFMVSCGSDRQLSDSGKGTLTGTVSETKTAALDSDKPSVYDSTTSTGDQDETASHLSRMVGNPKILHTPHDQSNLVQTFVDNESLTMYAKALFCEKRFRCRQDTRIKVDIGNLNDILTEHSKIHEGNLLISTPSQKDSMWKRVECEEMTLTLYEFSRKVEAMNFRVMFGQEIHRRQPGNIVLATCDADFTGMITAAVERGWEVELWTWSGCFPKLTKHPKHGSLLRICLLDDFTDFILLVEDLLQPNQFTAKELTKKLSKSGVVVRVRPSVVEHDRLSQAFRETLEKSAHFPVMYYPIAEPDPKFNAKEFLILFHSTEDDILCPSETICKKIVTREVVIPNLMNIIAFEQLKSRESLKYHNILSELQQQCINSDQRRSAHSSRSKKTSLCERYIRSHCPRGRFCPWPHSEDDVWCPYCKEYGHVMDTPKCKHYCYRSGPHTGHHRHKIGYQQRKTYRKTATQPLPTPGDYNEKEKNKIYRINARIKADRPPATNLEGTPTLQEIEIICHKVLGHVSKQSDWKQILYLVVPKDTVDGAVITFPKEPVRAMRMALDYWRNGRGSQPPTRSALLQTLVKANLQTLAMDIEDAFKKRP